MFYSFFPTVLQWERTDIHPGNLLELSNGSSLTIKALVLIAGGEIAIMLARVNREVILGCLPIGKVEEKALIAVNKSEGSIHPKRQKNDQSGRKSY